MIMEELGLVNAPDIYSGGVGWLGANAALIITVIASLPIAC
jgi:hypothetical protein